MSMKVHMNIYQPKYSITQQFLSLESTPSHNNTFTLSSILQPLPFPHYPSFHILPNSCPHKLSLPHTKLSPHYLTYTKLLPHYPSFEPSIPPSPSVSSMHHMGAILSPSPLPGPPTHPVHHIQGQGRRGRHPPNNGTPLDPLGEHGSLE